MPDKKRIPIPAEWPASQNLDPYYPGESTFVLDNDLTRFPGRPAAQGQVLWIRGTVRDWPGDPIAGAAVEIWQASANGRYNNPLDPNPAPVDPDFKYQGKTLSDPEGRYQFKTVVPGAYPAEEGWIHAPHVHYRVTCRGYEDYVTQMFFAGNPLNDVDKHVLQVPVSVRSHFVIALAAAPEDPRARLAIFDIRLKKR
jgi:protocatechuate 3,4-dioxygenase beta subunit